MKITKEEWADYKKWSDYVEGYYEGRRDGLATAVSLLNRQADGYENDSVMGDVYAEDQAMALREAAHNLAKEE